jgi:hypothetical protein
LFASLIVFAATLAMGQASSSTSGAQDQGTTPSNRQQMRQERREHMQAMRQEHMEAMRADLDKLKKSLAAMQASIPNIKDVNERARWQDNVDMWQVLVRHMESMTMHMEHMGPGAHGGPEDHHHGMGMGPGPGAPESGTSNPPPTK